MRVYLSGAMTGYPDLNFPYFHREAERLRGLGYDVVNPAEINTDPNADWSECMRKDIAELMTCNAIVMLNGWETSKGAHLEMHLAHRVGMQVIMINQL